MNPHHPRMPATGRSRRSGDVLAESIRHRLRRSRASLSVWLSLPLLLTGGCADRDTLVVVERIALDGGAASTLHVDAAGDLWLGRPGEVARLDRAGREVARFPVNGAEAPRFFGAAGSRLYFRTSLALLAIDTATDSIVERDGQPGDAGTVDPLGRFVLRTEEAGAVVGHEAATLEPVWGWGAVGAASHALAVSPQGDRVYQGVADPGEEGSAKLFVRDLFTGRVLRTLELPETPHALAVSAAGNLFVAGWEEDGGGGVSALVWERGELRASWRRSLGELRIGPPVRLVVSARDARVVVLGGNERAGLRVLDGETGRTLDRLGGDPVDVGLDASGRIYLLFPDEVRRVE